MPSPYLSNYGVIEFTGSSLALTAGGHAGQTVVSNLAATQAITLPAATGSGNVYKIFVATTKTGDLTITTDGSDDLVGGVEVTTDASGTPFLSDGTDTIITMNGSTTGGVKGSYVELQDVASATWLVSGRLVSTGTEATPFS
jgi:hypothetical protein